jgi:hypothetical protein
MFDHNYIIGIHLIPILMGRWYCCIQFNPVLNNVRRYSFEILVGPSKTSLYSRNKDSTSIAIERSRLTLSFTNYNSIVVSRFKSQIWTFSCNVHQTILKSCTFKCARISSTKFPLVHEGNQTLTPLNWFLEQCGHKCA